MQISRVVFEGSPPFQLPLPQSGRADVVDDIVVLTLHAVIDGQGPNPLPMMMQMTGATALAISQHLLAAGTKAEMNARR